MTRRILSVSLLILATAVVSLGQNPQHSASQKARAASFVLKSPAFQNGGMIPKKFTCDGDNVSPALEWSAPPVGTVSLALIVDDPDAPAGTWVHWVLYDLPASTRGLPEHVQPNEKVLGGLHGVSSFGKLGYGGPCPPHGPAHRYFFKLYALRAKTGLEPGATKADVERAMKDSILAEAELLGKYRR